MALLLTNKHTLFARTNGLIKRAPSSCMDLIEYSNDEVPFEVAPDEPDEDHYVQVSDLKKWAPTNVQAGSDGQVVLQQIADRGVQSILSSNKFKKTKVGSWNEAAKEKTRLDVRIKSDDGKQEHKVITQIQPFEGFAEVGVEGPIRLNFRLSPAKEEQVFRLTENIQAAQLYLQTTQNKTDVTNQVGFAINW